MNSHQTTSFTFTLLKPKKKRKKVKITISNLLIGMSDYNDSKLRPATP